MNNNTFIFNIYSLSTVLNLLSLQIKVSVGEATVKLLLTFIGKKYTVKKYYD